MHYLIMSKDRIVAESMNGVVEIINKELAPLRFFRNKNFEEWCSTRIMDLNRINSRILKRVLGLKTFDYEEIIRFNNLQTITDCYWVKPFNSEFKYEDIKAKENPYWRTALHGEFHNLPEYAQPTPELTNIGSYEKGWKLEYGEWWLYKYQTPSEVFSELFTCNLGKILQFDMAHYEIDSNPRIIKTKDFTNNGELIFEPAESLVGENDDYIVNYEILRKYSLESQYLDIIFLDTLVMNVDRHTFNYGLLRDPNTGKVVKLAPNYDNNLSFVARGFPKTSERRDALVKFFEEVKGFYNPPLVSKSVIEYALELTVDQYPYLNITKEQKKLLADFCYNGYKNLYG